VYLIKRRTIALSLLVYVYGTCCAFFVCVHSSLLYVHTVQCQSACSSRCCRWKVTWDTDAKINLWRNYITGATALEAPSKAWKCDNKKDRWITKVYAILYTIYYTDTADTQVCIASQCDSAHLGSA
jgi:hypothetical protein